MVIDLLDNQCRLCSLCLSADGAVKVRHTVSRSLPEILVVGYKPQKNEAEANIAFSSARGKLIDQILREYGVDLRKVQYTYLVRCYSSQVSDSAVMACSMYLVHEILTYKPKFVVFIGADAYNAFYGESMPIGKLHGRVFTKSYLDFSYKVLVTVDIDNLYAGDKSAYEVFRSDISKLKSYDKVQSLESSVLEGELLRSYVESVIERYQSGCLTHISFDIETSSIDRHEGYIIGVSVSDSPYKGYFIPFRHKECSVSEDVQVHYVLKLLKSVPVVCHNAKFDLLWILHKYGFLPKLLFDTYIGSYICFGEKHDHNLKLLSNMYLNLAGYEDELDEYVSRNRIKSYADVPFSILKSYAVTDAICTYLLYDFLSKKVSEYGMVELNNYLLRFLGVLIEIEENGIKVDLKELQDRRVDYEVKNRRLYEIIRDNPISLLFISQLYKDFSGEDGGRVRSKRGSKLWNCSVEIKPSEMVQLLRGILKDTEAYQSFSLTSLSTLSDLVFKTCGKSSSKKSEKTKKDSVDKESLNKLKVELVSELRKNKDFSDQAKNDTDIIKAVKGIVQCSSDGVELYDRVYERFGSEFCFNFVYLDLIEKLLEWRKNEKLLSTYFVGLSKHVKQSFIYPNFNLAGTHTGRLSASNPSLHVIPRGENVKTVFISRFDGGLILNSDFSQLEVRVLASFLYDRYGDDSLVRAYKQGKDLHTYTASKVFKKSESEVTKQERQIAKSITFGIIYEQSPVSMAEKNNLDVEYGKKVFEDYFKEFPSIPKFIEDQHKIGRQYGYVSTPFQRRRYVVHYEGMSNRLKAMLDRQSTNTLIQSTGSDLTITAILNITDYFKRNNMKSLIVNTVHDSIIVDVFPGELFEVVSVVEREMGVGLNERFSWLKCPMACEIEIGYRWGDGYKVSKIDDSGRSFCLEGDGSLDQFFSSLHIDLYKIKKFENFKTESSLTYKLYFN